jgi:hypothetical protein
MLLGVESPEVSSFSAGPIAHYQQTTGVCGGGGLNPEAEADLVHARDWYTQQREGLGAALLLCVEEEARSQIPGRCCETVEALSK